MSNHRVRVFFIVLITILVMRSYFLMESRHFLHFLLGIFITAIAIRRVQHLKKQQKSGLAHLTLIVVYVTVYTLVIWYVQPFVAGLLT